MTPKEAFALGLYAALLFSTMTGSTPRFFTSIVGWFILIASKKISDARKRRAVEQLSYVALLASLSYAHWYDAIAVWGYVGGLVGTPVAPLTIALYHAMAATSATTWTRMAFRGGMIVAALAPPQ